MNNVATDSKLIDINSSEHSHRVEKEIRSSPEEEFFSLSCLALKVKLIEQQKESNVDEEYVDGYRKDDYEVFNEISEG